MMSPHPDPHRMTGSGAKTLTFNTLEARQQTEGVLLAWFVCRLTSRFVGVLMFQQLFWFLELPRLIRMNSHTSCITCIYKGAVSPQPDPGRKQATVTNLTTLYQDLWRTNNRNIFLLFVHHKSWYSVVSLGRCSLFHSRVGLKTYQHPCIVYSVCMDISEVR